MNISRFLPLLLLANLPAQWTQASPAATAGSRTSQAMAGDLAGNVLMFGGTTSFSPLNQTWIWDGSTWAQLTPATSPSGRVQMEVVYDTLRSRYVVYGGWTTALSTGNANGETWEFDGTTWTQITPTASAGGLCRYGACYDVGRGRVVIYGGESNGLPIALSNTWEYDGAMWAQVAGASTPGPLESPAMCFDIANNRTVMFGGVNPQTGGTDTTWLFNGTSWTAASVTGARPAARSGAKMVYDAVHGVCVLVGGMNPTTGVALTDTWAWNGTAWTQIAANAPSVRAFGLAYDIVHGQIVHYGGVSGSTATSATWLFGAYATTFGSGCLGSNGVPALASAGAPRLGGNWSVTMNNCVVASPIAILVLGLTQLPGVPLDGIGMLGCSAWVSPDVMLTINAAGGVASWTGALPNQPSLVGAHLYAQGVSFDPGFNPAWLVASNAVYAVLGY
jgi:hypothetical protein